MGIPVYFRHITNKNPDIVVKVKINGVDSLYLDLNCAIHPIVRRVAELGQNVDAMIEEIIKYIVLLVEYTGVERLLYISIDGSAPRAKMDQQRIRRFKSIKEKGLVKDMKSRNHVEDNSTEFDTNSITPGTIFMEKLSQGIIAFLEKAKNGQFKHLKVIFSDSNCPGEGEHKILAHLRENRDDIVKDGKVVVYGLDADLIMLSIVSHVNHIYLLRESLDFGKDYHESGYKYLYLDIDLFKYHVIEDIKDKISLEIDDPIEELKILDDYIFMCFLLGNDFLPHLPSLHIKTGGIEYLMDIYAIVYGQLAKLTKRKFKSKIVYDENTKGLRSTTSGAYNEKWVYQHLISLDPCKINFEFLGLMIEFVAQSEDQMLGDMEKKRQYLRPKTGGIYKNDYEREKDLLDAYPLMHKEVEEQIQIRNPDGGWRDRYYQHVFKIKPTRRNINHICHNYLQGLVWILNYYYQGCISWNWYYQYLHAPTAVDLVHHLNDKENWKHIHLPKGQPYKPLEQLMIVLPPQSNHLLPKAYGDMMEKDNSPVIEYYPKDFKLDTLYKRFFWQCEPILPKINEGFLKKELSRIKLSEKDSHRNRVSQDLVIS